ncbi:MAG: PHP domain-containing protein [Chromatocurvus sp.]
MTVRVDFHTHTLASDGALAPAELMTRAAQAGVSMLAMTDHDTLEGYLEGRHLAAGHGVSLVPGVELSCQWSGAGIHVVGLGFDVDAPVLADGIASLQAARAGRAEEIAARLEKRGYAGALAGARACAGGSQIGRPHFARWMVDAGHVADVGVAFHRYLGRGRIGDVKACWPSLASVTGWLADAGGIAVVAHPLQYRFTRMKLRRLLTDFRAAGGRGLEILSGRQEANQTAAMARLARDFDLYASVGSDFHRDSTYGPSLGVESRLMAGMPNVVDALQGRTVSADADSAGRADSAQEQRTSQT